MKAKKSIIIVAMAVFVVAAVYYRFFVKAVQTNTGVEQTPTTGSNPAASREVSALATYKNPKGGDTVRFTLELDGQGAVVSVKTTNALKNDEVTENLAKFSQGLLLVIKGKKLRELKAVDRVGTSSLTTAAFNSALDELKAQL